MLELKYKIRVTVIIALQFVFVPVFVTLCCYGIVSFGIGVIVFTSFVTTSLFVGIVNQLKLEYVRKHHTANTFKSKLIVL